MAYKHVYDGGMGTWRGAMLRLHSRGSRAASPHPYYVVGYSD